MPRFEPYIERALTRPRTDPPLKFEIRPATLDDVTAVSQIHAGRDGGEPSEFAEAIARFVGTAGASGDPLLMVAEHQRAVIGFGKIRYFTRPDDAPPNMAPAGWYLSGLVVRPDQRRRGVGTQLTRARLEWIRQRANEAFYFANARNQVSIALHSQLGFVELTRDFSFPGVTFEGGVGVLFRVLFGSTT